MFPKFDNFEVQHVAQKHLHSFWNLSQRTVEQRAQVMYETFKFSLNDQGIFAQLPVLFVSETLEDG